MEKTTSVAMIGCGWAGERHARAFGQCGAKIRWLVDVNARRTEALGRLYPDARRSRDYKDVIADSQVDAVDICLPHNLHAAVALDCAAAGKHILCEKPIAATLDEADSMIDAAQKAGVVLMVAENEVFSPLYCKVRDFVADGLIGQPALVQMSRGCYLAKSFMEERPWFLDAEAAAGGMMMSGGVHDFEKLRMIIGEVDSVQAMRAPQRFHEMQGDDTSIAMVRFKNGAIGTMIQSYLMKNAMTAAGPEWHTLRIDGELGSIQAAGTHGGTIRIFSEREDLFPGEPFVEHEIYVPEQDTFYLEVEHFLHCLGSGEKPLTDGRRMRKPLEIVLAAYRSMETGKKMQLN